MSLVVVGGGPAGLAAARGYRAAGGRGPVTIVTDEDRAPYARPPLSKEYLRGELDVRDLQLEDDAWYVKHDVTLAFGCAGRIDLGERTVHARDTDAAWPWEDGLVLALGSEPQRPPLDGAEHPRVLVLRSAADSERLAAVTGPGTRVAVVGSGFVGCEAAASLARRGADVTLLAEEDVPQQARLGVEAGTRIAGWLRDEGVTLRTGSAVAGIAHDDDASRLATEAGAEVHADVVLLAAGAAPRVALAAMADLQLADDGTAIATDAGLATSAAGVFAAGDVARAMHPVAGRALRVEHWGDALGQGEVAGRRAAGEDATWRDVPGFWSTIGDRTVKHAAWGDGHDAVALTDHGDGAFTARYTRRGALVGVLTHDRDDDYDRAGAEITAAAAGSGT